MLDIGEIFDSIAYAIIAIPGEDHRNKSLQKIVQFLKEDCGITTLSDFKAKDSRVVSFIKYLFDEYDCTSHTKWKTLFSSAEKLVTEMEDISLIRSYNRARLTQFLLILHRHIINRSYGQRLKKAHLN